MKRAFLLIICLILEAKVCSIEVGTTNGVVNGQQLVIGEQKINVFRGIPYAAPPINDNRFGPPLPPESWSNPWNGTFYRPKCYPSYTFENETPQNYSENCLYINIFADNRCLTKLCPVIFHINPSPYDLKKDEKFNEKWIVQQYASKNLVVVVPQYRQGILGNLDLGRSKKAAPYNVELLDLIQALDWTNHEIGAFGGAPDRVTLMGQGAGADSVIYLATSRRVNPSHFHNIIIDNGIAPTSYHPNQKTSIAVSENLGCQNTSSILSQLNCLQNHTIDDLVDAIPDDVTTPFRPQIDNIVVYSDLWENPSKYLHPANLLLLINEVEDEFSYSTTAEEECYNHLSMFGYYTRAALTTCSEHFNRTEDVTTSSYHAFAVRLAGLNTRSGKASYLGVVAEEDTRSDEEDDGVLSSSSYGNDTKNGSFIKDFYSDIIRRFVMTSQPYTDWPKTDNQGQNYYYIKVDLDSPQKVFPSVVKNRHYDESSVHFWLDELDEVEKNNSSKGQRITPDVVNSNILAKNHRNDTKSKKSRWNHKKFHWKCRCNCCNGTRNGSVSTTTERNHENHRDTTVFDHKQHHNWTKPYKYDHQKHHTRPTWASTTTHWRTTTVYDGQHHPTTTTTHEWKTRNWTRRSHHNSHGHTRPYNLRPVNAVALNGPQDMTTTITSSQDTMDNTQGSTTPILIVSTTLAPQITTTRYYDTLLWSRYINFLTFTVIIIMGIGIVGLSRLLYMQMAARGGEDARRNMGELKQILTSAPLHKGYGLIGD